jgi:Trk K+ transport system NAD-binding subunit
MLPIAESEYKKRSFPWRSAAALFMFFGAVVGFSSGVSVSERPEVGSAGLLTHAYYSLSLFVVGGVDLGTPYGGPLLGRILVWVSYFGAPTLAASALIEALLRAIAPQAWLMRSLKDHIILVGGGNLSLSYLRVLRKHDKKITVVVACRNAMEQSALDEFEQGFGAIVVTGDITHEFFLRQLRVESARKILLFSDNSLRSYEAGSILLDLVPGIGPRVVIHCAKLRFMRAMENTRVARSCETFNAYHLAASGLVRGHMLQHFKETKPKDVVVIAGFGRFGQSVLEQLQLHAISELATLVIIEIDAHRRVRVAEEQMSFLGDYRREIYEGDISNPDVWDQLHREVDLESDNTVFVLGTGREEDNFRTSLWLRRKYPESMIITRTSKESQFAQREGRDHNIITVSISQLVEENIPRGWLDTEH